MANKTDDSEAMFIVEGSGCGRGCGYVVRGSGIVYVCVKILLERLYGSILQIERAWSVCDYT